MSNSRDNSRPLLTEEEQLYTSTTSNLNRRLLFQIVAAIALPAMALPPSSLASTTNTATDNFTTYSSPSQNYSFQRPESWEQVDKAGADVLFRDPSKKSSTLGMTVLPVMVPTLDKFGSLDIVAEKLIAAEKAKESTLSVEMRSQKQRETPFASAVYDFVYEVDSTRGRKIIVNCVAIVNSKLYILNGNVSCGKGVACGEDQLAVVELMKLAAQSLMIR
jgi:PsbP